VVTPTTITAGTTTAGAGDAITATPCARIRWSILFAALADTRVAEVQRVSIVVEPVADGAADGLKAARVDAVQGIVARVREEVQSLARVLLPISAS
jgi:hypothetical protein